MKQVTFNLPNTFILSETEGEVLRELKSQKSDRGLAVLGGSLVDDSLKGSLTWSWLSGKDNKTIGRSRDFLLKDGGALTFRAKIDLALVTGLISETVYSDLNRLRDLRNDFSHWVQTKDVNQSELVELTFDLQRIGSRCAAFKLVDAFVVILNGEPIPTDTARNRYLAMCMILHAAFVLFSANPTKQNKLINAVLKFSEG